MTGTNGISTSTNPNATMIRVNSAQNDLGRDIQEKVAAGEAELPSFNEWLWNNVLEEALGGLELPDSLKPRSSDEFLDDWTVNVGLDGEIHYVYTEEEDDEA